MGDVFEQVAIAARQASHGRKIIPPWEMLYRWERERWLEVARAAIKAYQEAKSSPTLRALHAEDLIAIKVMVHRHGRADLLRMARDKVITELVREPRIGRARAVKICQWLEQVGGGQKDWGDIDPELEA